MKWYDWLFILIAVFLLGAAVGYVIAMAVEEMVNGKHSEE